MRTQPPQHAESQCILSVQKLKVLRDKPLLRGIDWTVHSGEHWVILGPNGSGKTSLLNTLSAYLTPTSGRIEVLGNVFGEEDWSELRLHLGIVSASLTQRIQPDQTPIEVVAGGLQSMINFHGVLKRIDKRKAHTLLASLSCDYLARREWRFLSQGERQRVVIARALIADPALLILDEPCAGLDPVARDTFLDFIETLAAIPKGPALILVTHHVEEIRPVFTHALVLSQGLSLAAGPLKQVLTSEIMSQAFGVPLRISKKQSRWSLRKVWQQPKGL